MSDDGGDADGYAIRMILRHPPFTHPSDFAAHNCLRSFDDAHDEACTTHQPHFSSPCTHTCQLMWLLHGPVDQSASHAYRTWSRKMARRGKRARARRARTAQVQPVSLPCCALQQDC